MAGRPGRSGGHNRLTLEEHALRGTKPRRPPVSPWAGVLPTAPAPAARAPWTPDPAEIAALGAVGGRFLVQVRAEFDVDMIEGVLLLEAARTLDLLAAWRPLAATDPQAARLAIQYTRTFAALLGQVWRR